MTSEELRALVVANAKLINSIGTNVDTLVTAQTEVGQRVEQLVKTNNDVVAEVRKHESTLLRLLTSNNEMHKNFKELAACVDVLEAVPPKPPPRSDDAQRASGHSIEQRHQGHASGIHQIPRHTLGQGERDSILFSDPREADDIHDNYHPHARFGHARMPRTDFPTFDGTDPKWWKDCSEKHFHLFDMPHHNWASYATLHFHGLAKSWLQSHEVLHPIHSWSDLVIAVFDKFDKNKYEQQLDQLFKLKQLGTVTEYHTQFEDLMHKVLVHNKAYDETFMVNRFVSGLKSNIRIAIRLQTPRTIDAAVCLALVQEEELEYMQKRPYYKADHKENKSYARKQSTNDGILGATPDTDKKTEAKLTDKYESLRAMRRAKGLCYKCGDKYSPGHKCAAQVSLHVLEELLETLQLDTSDDDDHRTTAASDSEAECLHLSNDAVNGTATKTKTIKLHGLIDKLSVLILIDSGSSHNLISDRVVKFLQCPVIPAPVARVMLGDGRPIQSDSEVQNLQWWTQGHTFCTTMRVLPLGCYDIILGMD